MTVKIEIWLREATESGLKTSQIAEAEVIGVGVVAREG
jgi:hypothetical protein